MNNLEIVHINAVDIHRYPRETCLALGNFDGLHIGHQKLIGICKDIARKTKSVCSIMTFLPHPKKILSASNHYDELITPWEIKKELLQLLGVELLFLVDFTLEFSKISPSKFIELYINITNSNHVVIGEDFRYGSLGAGDSTSLVRSGQENNFKVSTVPSVLYEKQKVSSSLLRTLIRDGNITKANVLLNRAYQLRGKVVDGEKRGRLLGYPTANINLTDQYILPPNGVYAVEFLILNCNEKRLGVMNIGEKPTFNGTNNEVTLEVHIIDYAEDLYTKDVAVNILHFIRRERCFANSNELIKQIKMDIQNVIMLQNTASQR